MANRVIQRGYVPFVVIRPENDASQSLYTKLGFRKLYQMTRITFVPYLWTPSKEENGILRDDLENTSRLIDAYQDQSIITASEGEGAIKELPEDIEYSAEEDDQSCVYKGEVVVAEVEALDVFVRNEDGFEQVLLEPIKEKPLDRRRDQTID